MINIDRTDLEAKKEAASQIQGWFNEKDFLSLHKILTRFDKPINALEVGTWKGRTTVFTLLSLPNESTFTAIDIFIADNDHAMDHSICGKITGKEVYQQCYNNLLKYERDNVYVTLEEADSKIRLSRMVTDEEKFDFIFLDGDHSYKGFTRDFINGLKLLKPQGILCGHDFGMSGPDVTKLLLLLGRDLFYQFDLGSTVWVLAEDKIEEAKNRVKKIEKIFKWKLK